MMAFVSKFMNDIPLLLTCTCHVLTSVLIICQTYTYSTPVYPLLPSLYQVQDLILVHVGYIGEGECSHYSNPPPLLLNNSSLSLSQADKGNLNTQHKTFILARFG